MTITKTAVSEKPEEGYAVGDVIEYEIRVENDGNLTITDIIVTDELEGIEIEDGEGYTNNGDGTVSIEKLEPAAKDQEAEEGKNFVIIKASYTVTEETYKNEDGSIAKEVVNTATAEGKSPDPDEPDVPVVPGVDPEPLDPDAVLTVHYVYEDGSEAAKDFVKTYNIGDEYDVSSPVITGYTPDQAAVTGTIFKDTELTVVYKINPYVLTINYLYAGTGAVAAPQYKKVLNYKDLYDVASPAIEGYRRTIWRVQGRMPASDVVVTVWYVPENDWVIIIDDETPLGFGNLSVGGGECIE